ncbi:ATP-binding cassette domain-containing protein [Crossiella sp. CA198]|uniref:ATP-binding cassette domain-containing protein n=1 Tax=Crossiella sp. CA198 TaxID=3455607 RepID=UPI003F8D7667
MIEVDQVSKRHGATLAVDGLSFTVKPGVVTGFLGPNGAGKSTTMRMVLGLDRPDTGRVLVGGRDYRAEPAPLHRIGALLDAKAVHPHRSAQDHLWSLALTHGIPRARVAEVLDLVGLSTVATRRAGGFSLGMSQRLGIAAALLGDPEVLLLDEPVNGLDPDGIRWIRGLLRELAEAGRTVFVSSHLMSEMALTAQHLIVVGRGRLIADAAIESITAAASVRVRAPGADRLAEVLAGNGISVTRNAEDPRLLEVRGLSALEIGERAAAAGIVLHELTPVRASLEEAYLELTREALEYTA